MSEPTVGQRIDAALSDLKLVASAQGAMSWMVQGKTEKAQQVLEKLTVDQLQAVVGAAYALIEAADREIKRKGVAE